MPPRPAPKKKTAFLPILLGLFLCYAPSLSGQTVDLDLLGAIEARSIGPAGMSGRIAAIDAVESDPNIIFVGAATGGLWKSVNGGQTWDPSSTSSGSSGSAPWQFSRPVRTSSG